MQILFVKASLLAKRKYFEEEVHSQDKVLSEYTYYHMEFLLGMTNETFFSLSEFMVTWV